MEKEGNVSLPNFPQDPGKSNRASLPSDNSANKVPSRNEINPFAGLPAATGPRPMKIEGH